MGGYNYNQMNKNKSIISRNFPHLFSPAFKAEFIVPNTCPLHISNIDNCPDCFHYRMAIKEDNNNRTLSKYNPLLSHYNIISMIKNSDYLLALNK